MNKFKEELYKYILNLGASDVGFAKVDDFAGFKNAISIVVKLSDAIIDEIEQKPTHTYFNHYRTVNALIDNIMLKTGLYLEQNGYKYITVAASQSINENGNEFKGRYSHKKIACLSGLGTIGKSALFLHNKYGTRVRLGTIFTNCELNGNSTMPKSICVCCDLCVKACPALAIKNIEFDGQNPDNALLDYSACSNYMKREFASIGRGAVCGICVKICGADKNF